MNIVSSGFPVPPNGLSIQNLVIGAFSMQNNMIFDGFEVGWTARVNIKNENYADKG